MNINVSTMSHYMYFAIHMTRNLNRHSAFKSFKIRITPKFDRSEIKIVFVKTYCKLCIKCFYSIKKKKPTEASRKRSIPIILGRNVQKSFYWTRPFHSYRCSVLAERFGMSQYRVGGCL